jgi:hypothetical protein
MMDEDRFWEIIEQSRRRVDHAKVENGDEFHDQQTRQMREILMKLPLEDVIGFYARFDRLRDAAHKMPLWGAAYWLHGGCGDDSFMDFRGCLISLGKDVYRRVLKNPDELVDIVGGPDVPNLLSEGFAYVPREVYRERTGQEIPFQRPAASAVDEADEEDDDEAESSWDFDDAEEVARRLPRIYAKYPEGGDF